MEHRLIAFRGRYASQAFSHPTAPQDPPELSMPSAPSSHSLSRPQLPLTQFSNLAPTQITTIKGNSRWHGHVTTSPSSIKNTAFTSLGPLHVTSQRQQQQPARRPPPLTHSQQHTLLGSQLRTQLKARLGSDCTGGAGGYTPPVALRSSYLSTRPSQSSTSFSQQPDGTAGRTGGSYTNSTAAADSTADTKDVAQALQALLALLQQQRQAQQTLVTATLLSQEALKEAMQAWKQEASVARTCMQAQHDKIAKLLTDQWRSMKRQQGGRENHACRRSEDEYEGECGAAAFHRRHTRRRECMRSASAAATSRSPKLKKVRTTNGQRQDEELLGEPLTLSRSNSAHQGGVIVNPIFPCSSIHRCSSGQATCDNDKEESEEDIFGM